MNTKPILFSAEMVRAILAGTKTQTRRVIVPQIERIEELIYQRRKSGTIDEFTFLEFIKKCKYGQIGDLLWVRETWKCEELDSSGLDGVRFAADGAFIEIENTISASNAWMEANRPGGKWRPSIFMPRWASRINLEITGVRVDRVQHISREDAKAEGGSNIWSWDGKKPAKYHRRGVLNPYVANYSVLWDEINAERGFGWDMNPWVYVIEFERAEVRDAL